MVHRKSQMIILTSLMGLSMSFSGQGDWMPLGNVKGVYFYEFCRVEKPTLFLVDDTEKMNFTWIRRPLCMRF